jgi:hypothetical protein
MSSRALEAELVARGGHFDPADARATAARAWSQAQQDPDPVRWTQGFVDRGHLDVGP